MNIVIIFILLFGSCNLSACETEGKPEKSRVTQTHREEKSRINETPWGEASVELFEKLRSPETQDKQELIGLYNKFSYSFMALEGMEKPWDISFPVFGKFAEIMLKKIENSIEEKPDCRKNFIRDNHQNSINAFKKELSDYVEDNKTSYLWFLMYCDRLTALINKLFGYISITGFNTKFDVYKRRALCFSGPETWLTHEKYKDAQNRLGDRHTQEMLSLPALATLFPHVVCLPETFPLTDWDLVTNFPSKSRRQNLWFGAFSFTEVDADGAVMSPGTFFFHDMQHLAIEYSDFLSITFMVSDPNLVKAMFNRNFYSNVYKYLREGRDLFDRLHSKTIDLIIAKVTNSETKRMFEFFTFYWTHEGIINLQRRLYAAFHIDDFLYENVLNDKQYYLPLLSDRLQKLSQNERMNEVKRYAMEYNEFMKNEQDQNLQNNINNWINVCFISILGRKTYLYNTIFSPYDVDEQHTELLGHFMQLVTAKKKQEIMIEKDEGISYVNLTFPYTSTVENCVPLVKVIPDPKHEVFFTNLQKQMGSNPYIDFSCYDYLKLLFSWPAAGYIAAGAFGVLYLS